MIKNSLLLIGLTLIVSTGLSQSKIDFGPWPKGFSPQEAGIKVAENFIPRQHMLTPQDTTIHYAEACTWYGALTFAKLAGLKDLQERLIRRYDHLLEPGYASIIPKREHVDYNVWGIVPLELYMQTKDPRYLEIGKQKADNQWKDTLKGGLTKQTRFWIDDMYMISSLQAQAFRATGDVVYLNRAALNMVPYLDSLQQPNGLFFHGSKGQFHWSRGNGWMAAGMAELLRELPLNNPNRPRIMEGYKKMMAALLHYQDSDGMWHQLVDYPESWSETSSTGMFTFALITGVKNGWLDKNTYMPAAKKGWMALIGYLDNDGAVRNVCKGMGQRPTAEGYINAARVSGDYHGQAPLLWCASALLR